MAAAASAAVSGLVSGKSIAILVVSLSFALFLVVKFKLLSASISLGARAIIMYTATWARCALTAVCSTLGLFLMQPQLNRNDDDDEILLVRH